MHSIASALPHAAAAIAIAIAGPIRGKTAHKKIPKLANDRDTNVIGGGAAAAQGDRPSMRKTNRFLALTASAHSVDRGRSVQSIPPRDRNGGLFSAFLTAIKQ